MREGVLASGERYEKRYPKEPMTPGPLPRGSNLSITVASDNL
jgi:hypothetical protein